MKKERIVDSLRGILSKIDPARRYHYALVEHILDTAYHTVVTASYQRNEFDLSDYCVMDDVVIQKDLQRDESYVELAKPPMHIERVGSGVYQVRLGIGDGYEFYPVSMVDVKRIKRLEANRISERIPYYVMGSRIYFVNIPAYITGVNVLYVKNYIDYDDDAEVAMPSGGFTMVVREALAILGITAPSELINNNQDNTKDHGVTSVSEDK